jgi:hypothetical protein
LPPFRVPLSPHVRFKRTTPPSSAA